MQRALVLAVLIACGPKPAVREASLAFSSHEEDECSQTLVVAHGAGLVRLEWTPDGDARLSVREAAHYVGVTKASNRVEQNASCSEAVFVGTVHGTRFMFDRFQTDWHWSGDTRQPIRGETHASKLQLICRDASGVTECTAVGAPDSVTLPATTQWRFGRHLEPLHAAELESIRRCYP